jgi:hypothetical protein
VLSQRGADWLEIETPVPASKTQGDRLFVFSPGICYIVYKPEFKPIWRLRKHVLTAQEIRAERRPNHVAHRRRFSMNTLTLVLIVFLLVLVLGMQFQITALNKKINEALRRKQKKKYF